MATAKNKFIFLISLFSALSVHNVAIAKIEVVLGTISLEQNPNLILEVPHSEESEIVLSREQYVLSYNKYKRAPNWVAWKLDLNQMGNSGRSNEFNQDSELELYLSKNPNLGLHAVEHTEYKGSCFDRGHQVPSADRTDTRENNQATFLMSNMTPQTPHLNRVIWAHLEQYTRDLVQKQGKKVYVITGPIYDQDFGFIGPKKDIKVPSKGFKVIFILDANQNPEEINPNTQNISVIMPNTLKDGSSPLENRVELCKPLATGPTDRNDWLKYKTTLAEVERLSGLKILK